MEINMEQRFDTLENRFYNMEGRFDALDNTLHKLIAFLQEHVATKEDLKAYATKEDLKIFATREDIKRELAIQKMDLIDRMDTKILDLKNDLIRRFTPATV